MKLGVAIGLVWMLLAIALGYGYGNHVDPDRSYCDFYPTVCAQNGGKAPF